MTTPADVRTDEEAFAACLAGRPVPAGAQGLAAFTDAVRASATEPGRPNAALAELLATGLLVPTQEPSRGTAGRPARTSRKRPHVLISTLIAKFAAAGAVAKAAVAGSAVALTLTAGTAAAVLPAEDTTPSVAEVGDVEQPADAPEAEAPEAEAPEAEAPEAEAPEAEAPEAEAPGAEVPDVEAPEAEEPAPVEPELTQDEWAAGPAAGQSHG